MQIPVIIFDHINGVVMKAGPGQPGERKQPCSMKERGTWQASAMVQSRSIVPFCGLVRDVIRSRVALPMRVARATSLASSPA